MKELIQKFKEHVIEKCSNPEFIHNKWFVKYHLDILENLTMEVCDFYPECDRDIVSLMVWLHDYGKIINFNNQYEETLTSGLKKLIEIGFEKQFSEKVINYVNIMDKKVDIEKSSIEVQIMSSCDGVSHLVGPFFNLWWHENPNKTFEELMKDNVKKAMKDWNKKVVLPIVKEKFQVRYDILLEKCGKIPDKFF